MGKFITLEGPEGAGKTTLIKNIRDTLQQRGYETLVSREPGGTSVGEELRRIVKHSSEPVSLETELLIFSAARAQLVRQVFLPFLNQYKDGIILCDRFMDSTTVYQGYARGYDLERIDHLHRIAVGSCVPDLTLLLDLPVEVGFQRAGMRGNGTDRFESQAIVFHEKVRRGYLELAKQNPERFCVLDATKSPERVYGDANVAIRERLGI